MDQRQERAKFYDAHYRDPEAKRFYNSAVWKRVRAEKLTRTPFCERCKVENAQHVHHIKPLAECTEEEKIAPANLMSLCQPCHNVVEGGADASPVTMPTGQRVLVDDDDYHYVEDRATQIERFALKYCNHWRDDKRGQPFELHPIQTEFIRPVYGMVHRQTGLRLIDKLWLETGVGTGKTPLEAIFGLHDLLTTPGAQIYSLSNTFTQASYSFDAAKLFIKNNPHLDKLVKARKLRAKNYEIVFKPLDSKWTLLSGDGSKAGAAASLLLVDEDFQIEDRSAYNDIAYRMSKRPGSLQIHATNTAKTSNALYVDLHEMAEHTLTGGRRFNRKMFPVIWAAPADADPASPESWRMANKLIGITITEEAVRDKWNELSLTPQGLAQFRSLYLGQQVDPTERWIDLAKWDNCTHEFTADQVKDLPLYVGIDASDHDDLLAVVKVWPSLDTTYASAQFWLPKVTADKYEEKNEIKYSEWAAEKSITLIAEPTFSPEVQKKIAEQIIELHKKTPITSVCYDRAYSEHLIAALDAAGIPTQKVSQGWGVSSGCRELASRLTNQSIVLAPNSVLKFNAENVRVQPDSRGNYWPVKPGANGKYAGKRWAKIDGISALVTALTRAREHDFPRAEPAVGSWIINLDDD